MRIICLNGAAARKVAVGDILIIISYAYMTREEAVKYKPIAVFPDENNLIVSETTTNEQQPSVIQEEELTLFV